jgi:hypothetical protein
MAQTQELLARVALPADFMERVVANSHKLPESFWVEVIVGIVCFFLFSCLW